MNFPKNVSHLGNGSVFDNEANQCILVVDDEALIRKILKQMLSSKGYIVWEAGNGKEALERVDQLTPDLILLDIAMPEMNGLEALEELRKRPQTRLTPIIMITAYEQEKTKAFELGANDFISKPFQYDELMARVRAQLRLQQAIRDLEDAENILFFIAKVVEARDAYTEHHTERVAAVAQLLGQKLGLSQRELKVLRRGALLHDIGKVGIPEPILNKPGPLTPEERAEMERHVLIGYEICQPLRTLKEALPIIKHHHEKWDGTGYPDGLAGEEIPLLVRIVSVADVFDALTSDRPYRPAWPLKKALEYIREQAGKHFDPEIVKILMDENLPEKPDLYLYCSQAEKQSANERAH
ncbi:MAG: response regulator [Deltaproteobacteria bacterium]|nr:response regulator [Deltaproteobacteria bacterium]MBW2068102.1 response regulator [Deltaproteobacteria bacterium]